MNVDKSKYFSYAITSFISNVLIKSQDARQIGKLFMELDTERNGRLSMEDFVGSEQISECFGANAEDIFKRIDTN